MSKIFPNMIRFKTILQVSKFYEIGQWSLKYKGEDEEFIVDILLLRDERWEFHQKYQDDNNKILTNNGMKDIDPGQAWPL